jgi:hypothetical protein
MDFRRLTRVSAARSSRLPVRKGRREPEFVIQSIT